jgi:Ca-activated chloride channel homolog
MQDLLTVVGVTWDEWLRTRWGDLQFAQSRIALLVFVVLLAVALAALLVRCAGSRRPRRTHVALPALVPAIMRSRGATIRHLPLLVFLLGVPFFAVALADPYTGFTREEVSYPGRRIALLVDASASMVMNFNTSRLQTRGESVFFTATSAAEHFIRRRMDGPYRDLIALMQFGNEAYVVTPFTTDYENILLSIRLVSDPREWGRFNDWGTTIYQGIQQAIELFSTFEFTKASGNLIIVITDGRDSDLNRQGQTLSQIADSARAHGIPVYMIRTAHRMELGGVVQDKIWQPMVERTGGRFYAASDEDAILRATAEIDRLSPGRIEVRQYSVRRPRFGGYALIAVGLWLFAAVLKLGFRSFQTFP